LGYVIAVTKKEILRKNSLAFPDNKPRLKHTT